jgi:hypothetical protein
MANDPVLDELLALQAALDAAEAAANDTVLNYVGQLAKSDREGTLRIYEAMRANLSLPVAMDVVAKRTGQMPAASWDALLRALLS